MLQIKHTLTLTLNDSTTRVGFSVSRNELRAFVCVCLYACACMFVRQIIFTRNFYKKLRSKAPGSYLILILV